MIIACVWHMKLLLLTVHVCLFWPPNFDFVYCCQVEDLGNLIKLYADWHSRLIPYYSFEQFVRKVEKVGASNRVRVSFFFFPMLLQVN
jgi:hypothetical protein